MDNFLRLVSALVRYRAFYDITSNLACTIDSRTSARKYLLQLRTSVKLDDKSDDDDERHPERIIVEWKPCGDFCPWKINCGMLFSIYEDLGMDYI